MAKFEEAEYGIPHCRSFERTSDGFKLSFKARARHASASIGIGIFFLLVLWGIGGMACYVINLSVVPSDQHPSGPTSAGLAQGLITFLVLLVAEIVLFRLLFRSKPTTVEVTKDAVVIDKKFLKRSDFGGFHLHHSLNVSNKYENQTYGRLGYSYGVNNFEFGGLWPKGQADEVAAALNRELRMASRRSDETAVSPEQLRSAQPTDF